MFCNAPWFGCSRCYRSSLCSDRRQAVRRPKSHRCVRPIALSKRTAIRGAPGGPAIVLIVVLTTSALAAGARARAAGESSANVPAGAAQSPVQPTARQEMSPDLDDEATRNRVRRAKTGAEYASATARSTAHLWLVDPNHARPEDEQREVTIGANLFLA